MLGDGTNRYQFVHSDDLAEACVRAAATEGPDIFNVGTDRFGTMRETLADLCEHAGTGATVRSLPAAPASLGMRLSAALGISPFAPYHWMMYSKSMWFDLDHLQRSLAWTPGVVDRRHVRPELRLVRRQSGDGRRCRRLAPPSQRPSRRAVDREALVEPAARGTLNEFRRWLARRQSAVSVAVLVLLAYVPALTAAPGRMPSDSKLYVYLNPGRFLGDNDVHVRPPPVRRVGAAPAHRLPVADGPVVLVLRARSASPTGSPIDSGSARCSSPPASACAGWRGCSGSGPTAALAAAIVYQLSPYILPYVSRTSILLLPYAGLGWIVGLTVLAAQRGRWRFAAGVALVVLTVGAVNATALAMIIPAPALWLVHAVWQRSITWRRALATAAKVAVLSIAVSLWWIAMLMIQGKHGADVLAYSESLESVSFTSTSTEVLRGLGYWLFYIRDAFGATTTASLDYLASTRVIVFGVGLLAVVLSGLVFTTWQHRRYVALLIGSGLVLAVGVHPIDDPSPLMSVAAR